MKPPHSVMASRWIYLFIICFIGECSTQTPVLHPPIMSGDILTYVGDPFNPSIDIECLRPAEGWGDAGYVQIFKSEIYFPSVTFEKVIDGNLITDSTSIYRYIVATNTNLAGNAKPHHNRYSLSHTSSSLKLTIEYPVAEDSGIYKCRTTLAFSNRIDIDSAISLGQANVTIIEPVSQMEVFKVDIISSSTVNWNRRIVGVSDIATLNSGDPPTRFGCIAQYNTGLPMITAYWAQNGIRRPATDVNWQFTDLWQTVFTFPTDSVSVIKNGSVLLWATVGTGNDTDIPNIGARDGYSFVCEATFPGISPIQLKRSVDILVRSSTPTIPPTTTTSTTTTTGTVANTIVDDSSNFSPCQGLCAWAIIMPLLIVKIHAFLFF